MNDEHAVIALPFGHLGLRLRGPTLYGLEFLPPDSTLIAPRSAAAREVEVQLQAWCGGERTGFELEWQLEGTPFQQWVWAYMIAIPPGETRSYGEAARELGSSPRAVGGACGRNPLPIVVPCHRIVARQGLGGFNQGRQDWLLGVKAWLLEHEYRQAIKDNGVLNAPRYPA